MAKNTKSKSFTKEIREMMLVPPIISSGNGKGENEIEILIASGSHFK